MRASILAGYLTLVTVMMGHIAQTNDDGHWHILMVVGAIITGVWLAFGSYMLRTESKPPFTKDEDSADDDCSDS